MKKLALMLAFLMLLSSFTMISCSENSQSSENESNSQDTSTSEQVTSESEEAAETEAEPESDVYSDGLAAVGAQNYDGRDFTVITHAENLYESFAEELTGETTNDAIYDRNLKAEEICGISFNVVSADTHDKLTQMVNDSVAAGDCLYNLIAQKIYKVSELISAGSVGNWLDIPKIDFDAPWWVTETNNEFTINNKLFGISGDYCITNMLMLYTVFYNADAATSNGVTAESLQNYVFEGSWTIDKFNSIVSTIYTDVNGDNEKDKGDFYGLVLDGDGSLDAWLTAFDQPISEINEDGTVSIVFMNEKMISALEKVHALYYENDGSYYVGSWKNDVNRSIFNNGSAVFLLGELNDARTYHADVEFNLGILPYPKWDETQSNYYSIASDCFDQLAFPVNTAESDYEFLGTVTEVLTILSSRDVAPAFFDSALKGRYSMDKNTAEIVDLIMDGRKFDFSFQWGNQLTVPYMFRDAIINDSINIASSFKSKQKIVDKNLEKILVYYEN